MAQYDTASTTTTDLSSVSNFQITPQTPDESSSYGKTWWDFPDSSKYLGYYNDIPEIKSALDVWAKRIVGLGYETESPLHGVFLDHVSGSGNETFISIIQAMVKEAKYLGDSMAHIIRSDSGKLLNIKRLWLGNMRVICDQNGTIMRYEQVVAGNKKKPFQPDEILHLTNDKYGGAIHGTSIIIALKKIIEAKQEALEDERKIRHRELALGIMYVDTDDPTKITNAKTAYKNAIANGEVVVLPKGTVELADNGNKGPRDRIQWLMYLDNLFYQVIGIPKVLVTSEGYTEAGGKAGLLAFEPNEIAEKVEIEQQIWNQLGIKITLKRGPSLTQNLQQTEVKNAGQTNIQPNETNVTANRSS